MNKYHYFTPKEDKILVDNYFSMGAAKLSRSLLPKLTSQQISSRANHIGVSFDKSLIGKHLINTEDLSVFIDVKTPFSAYVLGFLWAD